MKTDRVLAIVRSMIQRQADEIAMLTNPNIHWNMEDRLLDLARLKAVLVQDRLVELEQELAKTRLERRYLENELLNAALDVINTVKPSNAKEVACLDQLATTVGNLRQSA